MLTEPNVKRKNGVAYEKNLTSKVLYQHGINLFAKGEKHLGFQRLKYFFLARYLIDFKKNYVSNGTTQGTAFQYVSVFLFCCSPVTLHFLFVVVVVVVVQLLTFDERFFLK